MMTVYNDGGGLKLGNVIAEIFDIPDKRHSESKVE